MPPQIVTVEAAVLFTSENVASPKMLFVEEMHRPVTITLPFFEIPDFAALGNNTHYTEEDFSAEYIVQNVDVAKRPPPPNASYGSPETVIEFGDGILDSMRQSELEGKKDYITITVPIFNLQNISSVVGAFEQAKAILESTSSSRRRLLQEQFIFDSLGNIVAELKVI